jgi:hypothetical protein
VEFLPTAPHLSYVGYQFDSPVATVKEEREFDRGVVLSFADCVGMSLFASEDGSVLVKAMRQAGATKGQQSDLEAIFGTETLRSDYALRSRIFNLTPADLRLFFRPRELAGNSSMLMLKSVETQRFKNGLYSFQTRWMRGFQEGDITRDRGVVVEAYDVQDRQIMLIIGNKKGKSCFTQTQINRIISTLKPVSE